MSKPLVITTHAREAMQLRRVTIDEIIEITQHPEVTDKDRHGVVRYFRGRLCVVTQDSERKTIVKTVLYRYGDKWTDEDVRKRSL